VEDTLKALGDLASWHRDKYELRVVGITGSNGKTSTKELTASVLGSTPGVLFNVGNLNNLIGMPRSVLSLGSLHHHMVMEMGMNTPGEIKRLAEIAKPQIGVITNIHPVHLEGLGSIENIARAKGELFMSLPSEGTAVVNGDDRLVVQQSERAQCHRVTFGHDPSAQVQILTAGQERHFLRVELALNGRKISLRIMRPGIHNAMNAAAAAAVGMIEGIEPEKIAERLEAAPLPALRMELLDLGGGHLLIDCYNANPESVIVAGDFNSTPWSHAMRHYDSPCSPSKRAIPVS